MCDQHIYFPKTAPGSSRGCCCTRPGRSGPRGRTRPGVRHDPAPAPAGRHREAQRLSGRPAEADPAARTPAGQAHEYYSFGDKVPYLGNRVSLGDWSGLSLVRQADLNRDFYQDYLYRTSDGVLYDFAFNGSDRYESIRIGGGWSSYAITGKGDYNNDGKPDLLARDGYGVLWLYPGTGTASRALGTRIKIGSGWNTYNTFATAGDITGDGRPDLLARDGSGVLWLYKGTGAASAVFKSRVKVGSGWGAFNLFG